VSVREVLASEGCLLTSQHSEAINAQAEVYLDELRAATAAAHERLRAGVMRLLPQADDVPVTHELDDQFPPETDPIFATREFDVPPQAVGGLVDFGADTDTETDADGIPVWKD
jgi:hypothetical protein